MLSVVAAATTMVSVRAGQRQQRRPQSYVPKPVSPRPQRLKTKVLAAFFFRYSSPPPLPLAAVWQYYVPFKSASILQHSLTRFCSKTD